MKTMSKIFIFTLFIFSSSVSMAFNCSTAGGKTASETEFCQKGFLALFKLQEAILQHKLPVHVDIESMQETLLSSSSDFVLPVGWDSKSNPAKFNSTLVVLNGSNSSSFLITETLDSLQISKIQLAQNSRDGGSSTGTRGGGFGQEQFEIPLSFWID